jgi:GRAM domain-containing protein 4
LEDLRRHREEVIRANEFGEQVLARLSASSTGVTEIIHLFKLLKERPWKTAKQKVKDMSSAEPTEETGDVPLKERNMTVPEDAVDQEEAAAIMRIVIYTLNEIADLHERVRKYVPFS